jgi:biotin carboxyl carrier protein
MKDTYRRRGGAAHEVTVEAAGALKARVRTGDLDAVLQATPLGPGRFRLSDGAWSWLVCVDREGAQRHVTIAGVGEARFEKEAKGRRRREAPPGSLSSPMPGTVVKVLVKVGDPVAKGAELMLVEAMKMEIKIEAPLAGTVKEVRKREGEPCDAGEILVEIEP